MTKRNWTDADQRFLRDNLAMTDEQLALQLGRTVDSIRIKRGKLGLIRNAKPVPAPIDRRHAPIYHGKIPDNPITAEWVQQIDYMRERHGTYNCGRA